LETGEILKDKISPVAPYMAWDGDSQYLFYTTQDRETLRTNKIFRHRLGEKSRKDELIYEEKDITFDVQIAASRSKEMLFIISHSTLTTEYQYLDARNPQGEFRVFQERIRGVEYHVDHGGDCFFISSNAEEATNFKLLKSPLDKTAKENWQEVVAHRADVYIEDFEVFEDFLVLAEKNMGLPQLRILGRSDDRDFSVVFPESCYTAYPYNNREYKTTTLRYAYESLTTPFSTYDFDIEKRQSLLKKQVEVLGGFSSENYQSERIFAPSKDGGQIPISLVYRKGLKKDGKNPTLMYGYGSYGISMEPNFRSSIISLLDRGFIYALTHVRGGADLGRKWYEDGKMFMKKNSFLDFIACSEFLIQEKYTSNKHLYAMGGSAGGLLVGAVMNMRPDLYHGVVAAVPFVDVITTMLNDKIPLTASEYDEWGNPKEKEYYDYILSYSPYDNVKAQAYPNLLVTTGFHDSQVQYWEPAKWVAKLRKLKTDNNLLLLKTNLEAGHSGASGRFQSLKETALEFAFLLHLEQFSNVLSG
jgi:oligopeptidase B